MKKKKQKKMRSFAKRLTRRIVLMQLIAMGIASVFIYIFVKDLVKMEELDRHCQGGAGTLGCQYRLFQPCS